MAQCASYFHLRQVITYQPASRFWPFQWEESAIFVVLAGLLVAFCFWWVHRTYNGAGGRRHRWGAPRATEDRTMREAPAADEPAVVADPSQGELRPADDRPTVLSLRLVREP